MYLLSNYFEVFLNSLESIFCKCKRAVQLHYLQKLSTHYMHRKVYNYKHRGQWSMPWHFLMKIILTTWRQFLFFLKHIDQLLCSINCNLYSKVKFLPIFSNFPCINFQNFSPSFFSLSFYHSKSCLVMRYDWHFSCLFGVHEP